MPKYVKAHQDNETSYENLDSLLQMNVKMDWLAKVGNQAVKDGTILMTQQSSHPLGFTPVTIHNKPLPHQLSSMLYEAITEKFLHQWWLLKAKYTLRDIPAIHWEVCERANETSGHTAQVFASKWASGFLATGSKVQQ